MQNKSIACIVNENFVYAKVLDFFGVEFYESRNKTLEQVCAENSITVDQLRTVLESTSAKQAIDFLELRKYPIKLIVEYLKHSHQVFIKDTLPFLLKTVNNLNEQTSSELQKDLKMILPMFVEDFIHHIYEEEDRFFAYVLELDRIIQHQNYHSHLLNKYDKFSIQEFALHHHDSDDEMSGIRGITDSYKVTETTDMQVRVIFQELKSFDQQLVDHARIENDILFPRALELEKQVMRHLKTRTQLN